MHRVSFLFFTPILATLSLASAASAMAQEQGEKPPVLYAPGDDEKSRARREAVEKAKQKAKEKAQERAKQRAEGKEDVIGDGPVPTGAPPSVKEPPRDNRSSKVAQAAPPSAPAPPAAGANAKGGKVETKVDLSTCTPMTGKINFNFEKATINEVLDQISRIRCMNFILSDAVKGKNDITIVSRSPVSVNQAYAAFLSALEANGMAMVPAGVFWKIVERKDAAKNNIPTYEIRNGVLQRIERDEKREGEFPNSDAQVTLIYDIKFANKDQVQNLVRNLMSKNADLQVPAGNMLILTDSGANILRILEVLDKVDVEGTSSQLHTVTLQYADVQSVASKLSEIFGVGAGGDKRAPTSRATTRPKVTEGKEKPAEGETGSGSDDFADVAIEKIIPEERTNQLFIISSPRAFEEVLKVIRMLDVPSPGGEGELKMWVVPLANSDANKMASTISSLASGAAKPKTSGDKGGAKAKEQAQAAALFQGEVKVTADEQTNSLVVVASYRDFRALNKVIDQLDTRRPQVFVEAAILEVALTQDRRVGLNAYGAAPVPIPGSETPGIALVANEGGRQIFQSSAKVATGLQLLQQLADDNRLDATSAQLGLDLVNDLSSLVGVASFVGPSVPILTDANGNALVSLPSVSTVVNLLQSNANVDILSTPHIMTTDNEKAEISVGQRIPVVRGISPLSGAGALGFGGLQQVAYEDVKLKFTITPHVNSDGEVRIELEQEVSDLGGQVSVGNGLTQPIITNRTVKNVVVAKDQQTIVIAGLIQDRKSDTESKVPFFGDIPIIGWLFKTWSDNKQKTNLLIVLTPYIVRKDEDFQKIYERKMEERRRFVDAYFSDARVYNPYIDYDKKTGPIGELNRAIEWEMMKIENGGPGHGEELIGPDVGIKPRPIGEGEGEGEGEGDNGEAPPPPPPEAPEGGITSPPPPEVTP